MNDYHILWECHHRDELDYEAGTLIVPTGSERICSRVGNRVLFVGDSVVHIPSGRRGVIQRIVYWHRVRRDGSKYEYYQVDYETPGGMHLNDTAENFQINGAAFPQSDMEIPF